jgi:FkbM family methyltransferase
METRLIDLGQLRPRPTVWDAGAFEGAWSRDIQAHYPDCDPILFEPVPAYYKRLKEQGFMVNDFGLSDHDHEQQITIAGDRSSTFEMGHEGIGKAVIQLHDIADEILDRHIDVLKLNVEGEEYNILERLLQTSKMKQIGILLVQFHTFIPQFGERYLAIKKALYNTHALIWRQPFVWERWDISTS